MGAAEPDEVSHAARVAARNLRLDHVTAKVLRAFDRAGVASILLKGRGTVRWLYQGEPRAYEDCDLLVSPGAMSAAEDALRGLGFVPRLDERRMPTWWREHAIGWLEAESGVTVDLHRTLTGVGVDDGRAFEILSADTERMTVGGFPALILSAPGRALNLALHAAQHGGDRGELRRALIHAGEDTWRGAARLAEEVDATAAFVAGLALHPEGQALAESMGLPQEATLEVALRAAKAPAEALTIERIARASGARERVAMIRHKLIPPPTFMRHWSPLARRGRAGLLLAYLRRLLWVAKETPAALRAWLGARRGPAQGDPPSGRP